MVKTNNEIALMREGGRRLAQILAELASMVRVGVSTLALEERACKRIEESAAQPVFLGYQGARESVPFPACLCVSINDEVVHAPATVDRTIKEGDVVSLDFGLRYPKERGLIVDMAVTVAVGAVGERARQLIDITRHSLEEGLTSVRSGAKLQDISRSVQHTVERYGFSVVRDFVGHGVGHKLHEPPQIPNYVDGRFPNPPLVAGMCLAIEPMVVTGRPGVFVGDDGWTVRTRDGGLSAHFEHTVVVTEQGCEVLTQ